MNTTIGEADIGKIFFEFGALMKNGLNFNTFKKIQESPLFSELIYKIPLENEHQEARTLEDDINKLLEIAMDTHLSGFSSQIDSLPSTSLEHSLIGNIFCKILLLNM